MPRPLAMVAPLAAACILLVSGCFGGDGGRADIAFVSTRDRDYAVYVMDASGGHQRRLTDNPVSNPTTPDEVSFQVEPAWSPDGTQIAFSSRREGTFHVYVMKADGTATTQITSTKEHDSHPTWSPDGGRIAFARNGDIFVMDADGLDQHRISDPLSEELEPAWSPDGVWIAYARRTPGTTVREIWLAHPDGADRHRLTNLAATTLGPAWSPDSKRIAFAGALEGAVYDIYSIGIGGKGLRRHTQSPEDAFEPSWSPDGSTIAFTRAGAISTIDLSGNVEELTNPDDNDSSPAWNPKPPSD